MIVGLRTSAPTYHEEYPRPLAAGMFIKHENTTPAITESA